jgi:hypothetical protein
VFAGRLVYQTLQPVAGPGSRLLVFDGQHVTLPLAPGIYDFTVSGPALYALTTTGAVLRTTDLVSWAPIGTAPPGSRSIGALQGRLYVGTTGARLYRLRAPLEPVGTSLSLGLTLNAVDFQPGDPLSANLVMANPGPAAFVDVYLGAVLPAAAGPGLGCPAGDAVAFVADGFTRIVLTCLSAPPASFPPLFHQILVPADLPPTAVPGFFSQPVPPGLPVGPYRLFVAAASPGAFLDETVDPGDVSTLATAEFAIVP